MTVARWAFAVSQSARKPNEVEVPGAIVPLELTFVAVTAEPLCTTVAFQYWVIVCPLGNVQVTRQPLMVVVPVFVTFTCAWKPPGHWFTKLYAAAQVPVPPWDGVTDGDGEGDAERDTDGEGEGEGDGDADGDGDAERDTDGDGDGEDWLGWLPHTWVVPSNSTMLLVLTGVAFTALGTPWYDQSPADRAPRGR